MSTIIRPAEKLGVTAENREFYIKSYAYTQRLLNCDDPLQHPENLGGLTWLDLAWDLADESAQAAKESYLEGDWSECIKWCRTTGEAHEYYFFGDWREKEPHDDGVIDPRRWFEKEPAMTWVQYYDLFVPWVAVGHHWELVSRLFEFPCSKVVADDDGPAARSYYLNLAKWWRNRQDVGGIEEAKKVRGAGSKMYHLLCDIAIGISSKDVTALQKDFPKYVQHFLKRRDHAEQFPMAATFLWNVAKLDGLSILLPEEIAKFLFEIPQEHWTEHGESS